MVAIVSGNSLGLSLTSLGTLGQRGVLGTAGQGRNGEQAYVNIANGNLILQDFDDKLVARGADIGVVRTYNSQGLLNDDNGDNWIVGAYGQQVRLTGTVATAGSTLVRIDRDGASATYTWSVAKNAYVSNAGAGAFDTIAYDAATARYVWTDGSTGLVERYETTGQGRLMSVVDSSGNAISYTYNANGTMQSMVNANGETTFFDYSGTNLTQIRTVATGGAALIRVRYAYDSANRLTSVTVDLGPEDNSVADGKTYITTYTYDDTSKRIASVTQSDGTSLAFTYVQAGGSYKVATIVDALGQTTRFTYDGIAGTTTVTDPLGAQSTYLYDAQGQLLQMRQGVTAGNISGLSQISYRYDAVGNVSGVTDGEGHEVVYEYDANGNLLKETDSAGNARTRTYNAANQLLTETVYADAAVSRGAFSKEASLPEITRYVYAQGNARLLRFVVSAQGDVTEHRYDSYGQALTSIRYAGGGYNVASLGASAVPTEVQMTTWVGTQDLRRTERTDRIYDARGALGATTTYGEVDAAGVGVAATAAKTQYVYDQHGWLLKIIEPTGGGTTTYVYDGLGRVLSISAPSLDGGTTANTTVTSYDDVGGKTSVTVAGGLVSVSAYDKAGRLVTVTQQSAGTGVLGVTKYAYDKDGNLLMTQDPTGVRKWMLYDAADRKIADVDATGALVEYVYNANGQLRQTIAYAARVDVQKLVDTAGAPFTAWSADGSTAGLANIRPTGTPQDQKSWRFYDNAGRLAWQVDALGFVTQTTYDGASRMLSMTKLANPIDVAPLLHGASIDLGVDPTTLGGIALSLDNLEPVPAGRVAVLTATAEGTPSGSMVTFFDGETVIGSVVLVDGKASLLTDRLSVGTHDLRVAFSGDGLRPASVSKAIKKVITPAVVAAEVRYQSPAPGTTEPLILSLVLSAESAWLVPQSGKVVFYNGSVILGEAYIANGVANLILQSWPSGKLNVRAEYSGDAAHTSAAAQRSFVPVVPSLTLGASTTRVTNGAPITLRAEVSGRKSGVVAFYAGKISLGTADVVDGVATLILDFLQMGTYALNATYSDIDGSFSGVIERGPTLQIDIVNQSNVQTFNWTSVNNGSYLTSGDYWNYQLYINAGPWQIDGQVQVGTVPQIEVWDNSKSIGTSGTYAIFVDDILVGSAVNWVGENGVGWDRSFIFSLPVNLLPSEGHRLAIVYNKREGRDQNGNTGRSGLVINTVLPIREAATAATLNVSSVRASAGTPITLNAKISMALPYDVKGTPSSDPLPIGGVVNFYANGIAIGTATVINGEASLVVGNLPQGTSTITASYAGDGSYLPSETSGGLSVQVTPPAVTLINLTTPTIAKDGALLVRVAGETPTGLVSFYSGTTLLGTVAVREDGTATLRGVPIPVGTHTFSAVYSGDPLNADGAVTFTQTVTGTPSTTVLVGLDAAQDRTTTQLYNRNGQLQGVLDAEGYLTEYKYNAAGEQVQTIRSATRAANFASVSARMMAVAIARASGDLTGVRPATSVDDIRTYTFYNARGQIVGQVDGEGYLTETTYDLRGNVTQTTRYTKLAKSPATVGATLATVRPDVDPLDQVVSQTWSAANQLLSRTNVEGTLTSFTYDLAGRLVQTSTAAGTTDERIERQRYDLQGRLIGELDGRGSAAVALADPLSAWSVNGSTHAYDAAGRRTSTIDANGHRTLFFYDALGRLTYSVNAMGEVTENRYDALGQRSDVIVYGTPVNVTTLGATTPGGLNTDTLKAQLGTVADTAKDRHTVLRYNATGTLASSSDAVTATTNNLTSYSYNAFREVTASSQTRLSGQVVTDTIGYDRRGLKTSTTEDATGVAAIRGTGYDAFGRATTRIDGNGNADSIAYDRLGRIVTTTDANGAKRTTTYDAFNRVLTQRDALNNTTSYAYSVVNRSITVTTPEGVAVTTVHNRHGQTQSIVDGRGNTTSYSYDKSGNLLKTQAPESVSTSSTYDKIGLKLTSTDARGTVTSYTYDAADRLLTRTVDSNGLKLVTTYKYDATGQKISVTDPGGAVTTYKYDLDGQVLQETVDSSNGAYVGLNLQTVYTYDTDGTTLTVKGPDGRLTRYTYDGAGRRIKEQVDPLGLNLTRSYGYDGQGNVVKAVDGVGSATLYIYDKANRKVFTIDPMGSVRQTGYDAEGRVNAETTYAAAMPVADLKGAAPGLPAMLALLPTLGSAATQRLRHDRDGRLRFTVDGTGGVVEYQYDLGNNVVETRAYAKRIDPAAWNPTTDPAVVIDDAHDQRTRNVYDALGRKTYTLDGTGAVVKQIFDANGNVTERLAYSKRVPVATAPTAAALATAVAAVANAGRDQRDVYVYDRANRQTSHTNGVGTVTTQTFDKNGNVTNRSYWNAKQAGTNLLTQSEFSNGVSDAPYKTGAVTASAMAGFAGALRLASDPSGTSAYKSLATIPGATYTLSVIVEMEDGQPPSFVNASASSATNSFGLALFSGATDPTTYAVQNLGGGRYRVSVTGVAPASPGVYFGAVKYAGNDSRAFRVSGYQLEQTSANLLTQSEFANGLADAPVRAGAVSVASMTGLAGALRIAPNPSGPYSLAYKTLATVPGTTYTLSVIVEMEDGQAPVFGNPAVDNAANSFGVVMFGSGVATNNYAVQDLGNGRYRISATVTAPAAPGLNFGVVKYTTNDARAFRVSGYKLEQVGAGNVTSTTTAAITAAADARKQVTRFAYDSAGRLVYTLSPLGQVEKNTYDAAGRVTLVTRYAKAIDPANLGASPTVAQLDALVQAKTNLFTQSEFANGLSDAPVKAGVVSVASMTGLAGALRIAPDPNGPHSLVYKTLATVPGTTYTLSVIVEMEDGQAPAFGNPTVNDAANSFGVIMFGGSVATNKYVVQSLGSGRYRISATAVAPAAPGLNFGVVKYAVNDARAFRVSGFQLEQAAAAGTYVPTTTASTAAKDQLQHSVYDKAGRLVASVDALGNTVKYTRDGNGDVSEKRAFYNPINMASWVPGTAPAPTADDTRDQRTRSFYDAAGREALSVDSLGYAVQRQYDAQGRLSAIVRYPVAIPAATVITLQAQLDAAIKLSSTSGRALQITAYGYDAAGLRISETAAFGQPEAAVTRYVYDGIGRLTRTVDARGVELSQSDSQWALNERRLLKYTNAAGGALKAVDLTQVQRDALAARYTTVIDYDAAGRKVSVTDPLGGITRSDYDANGHVVKITDPRGNAAFYYFDAAGRVTLNVDPEGYATATNYDMFGQTLSIKRYFNKVTGTYSAAQAPALPSANGSDALTRFEYDAVGRLTRTIDAESNAERYTYNALGQRETLTNKLGGVTTYSFDRLGRVVSETLPITSKNAAGQTVAVVNRSTYDAFGNKLTTTEAAGLPEQRVTTYTYDGLNRQLTVRQASVSLYTATGGWTTASPTRTNTYDASGNLIVTVDANGGRTRSWFDANNRKVAEVSVTGTLSQWVYDPVGNVMVQNVYGDVLPLPASDTLPVPLNAANVRTTTYQVDANNRVLSSTIGQVEFGEYDAATAQYNMGRRDLIQRSAYDANGNVVRQENGRNAATHTWYDKLGQKVLEVDAKGYGVRWERDANGAVFRETRYLQSIDLGSTSESVPLADVLAKLKAVTGDQITDYTYDRNGRMLSESRLAVAYGSVNASGVLTEGTLAATKRYGYDAMGNRTSVADAKSQRTDLAYDRSGRLLSERKPAVVTDTGAGTSASLRQITEYEYDGLNNVRREIRRGTNNAVETDDQIVRYGYDATGVRTSLVTAKGETFTYGRDANGNTTAQMVDRLDADGNVAREMVSIGYDAANRETTRFTGTRDAANAPVFDVAKTVTLGYNAYGELASKRTGSGNASGVAQEYYDYDKAGRLWRTNSQEGVNKAWMYDMAGNATLLLQSQRVNLRAMTWEQMAGDGSRPDPDILITITAYDKNNRAVSVMQPKMDASRPNLKMFATAINVDSGKYGGLDLAVASPLAGTTSIQGPSDTSATGQVAVLGMPMSGGNIRPITNGEFGGAGGWNNVSSKVVGVTDIVLGSAGSPGSNIESIYGAVTWRVEVGGVPNYLGRVTTWPVTVHPRNADINIMMGQLPHTLALDRAVAYSQLIPIRVVATAQSSGMDIVVTTGAVRTAPQPTQIEGLSGTFMRLTAGEARDSDTIQLYHRPSGSTGAFTESLPKFKAGQGGSSLNGASVDGWYLTRLDSLSGLTELLVVVTQADGKVVRRDSIQWNPTTRQATSSVAQAKPVFTADNVAHFTGLQLSGTSPAAIRVRQSSQGGSSDVIHWPVAGAKGRFDVRLGAGANDVTIDMLDPQGAVMDTLVGSMNAGSSLYDMRVLGSLPSSVTFRDVPLAAQTLTVEYQPLTTGGKPAGSVSLTRQAGKAEWVWDARSLVTDPRNLYNYAVHFVARDADGFILTDATGNVTIGAVSNGTKASLTGSVKHQILTFDPGLPEGKTLKLRYRVKGATTQDFIEATATRGTINAVFKWDATANNLDPAKEYEFIYDVYNAANAVIGNGEGYFRPDSDSSNDGSNVNVQWGIPNLPGDQVVNGTWVIQRRQDYDAFGQVVMEKDGNENVTNLRYNTLGLLVDKIGPMVEVTLANGQKQMLQPTEHYGYNLNGQIVGKRDANGNLSTLDINAAGQTVAEWHPGAAAGSSTAVRKTYDIFGNLITVTDEMGRITKNTYDFNNRLERVDRPINVDGSRAYDIYAYDVLGQRIAHTNALSFKERTYYDSMGRVTRYISAEGAAVNYGYTYDKTIGSAGGVNTGGWVNTTTDANGKVQTIKNDAFGRAMWKQDFGGHQFTYGYNWSGLIATQTGTSGQNTSYSYYDNGYLRKVIDAGVSTESTFEYDNNGNRTFEGFKSTASGVAMVFQQSRVSYDAFNRVKTIDDARYLINYEYDANGNRRRVHSTYTNIVDNSKEIQDYWYAYDGMNRFTVTMGQLVNGQVVRGSSGDGVTIEYNNAGQRKAATYASDGHREDYDYDGAGNLTTMKLNGVLRSRRTNDLAGRVTRYEELFADQSINVQKDRSWNKDNQLTQEVESTFSQGGTKASLATTTYGLMADGTLSNTSTTTNKYDPTPGLPNNGISITVLNTAYAYEWWDSAKQTSITVGANSTDVTTPWAPGYSAFTYDVNGHVKTATDRNLTTPRSFSYWTNAEGQVLQRQELIGGTVDPQTGAVNLTGAAKSRDRRYFYFDGKRVGNVGNDGTEREDYAQQLARSANAFESPDNKYRKFTPTNSADFDENYQPINAGFPGAAPGSYTVRAGDTLEGIARSLWGDATLWYLLAEANGLDGQPSAPLVANTVIAVPNRVTNVHNTSDTFRPYDPGKAMGDTSPTLPDPLPAPKGKDGGCGGVGKIIVAIVAVVATVFTAGVAAVGIGSSLGTIMSAGAGVMGMGGGVIGSFVAGGMSTGAMIGTVALAGAAGSVAGQLTGMALGIQDSFSWKGVALGAVGAGVSAGVGGWLQGGGLGGMLSGSSNGAAAGRLAVSNLATQGLSIATGLQKGFDWRGVAASAASGFVSVSAGAWAQDAGWAMASQRLASSMAGGVVSAVVRGGSISRALPGIIGDAVGAAMTVGNQVAGDIAGADRIDPRNPYGYGGSSNGITNWPDNTTAIVSPKAYLSDDDVAWLGTENAWLGSDSEHMPGVQYADASKALRTGVATDAGLVGSDAYRLIGRGMLPTLAAEDVFFGPTALKLRLAQDAADAANMSKVDYSLLPEGTSIRWLPALSTPNYSSTDTFWDGVKATWNSVVIGTTQLGASVLSSYARTSANYQETLGAGWIGPRLSSPYPSESGFDLSASVPKADYDTPYGAKVERVADVAQLFAGGYGAVKWIGAKTLVAGLGTGYTSDADASFLGSARKLITPALGERVALEHVTQSGVAIVRTGEKAYAQLSLQGKTQDYRELLAKLDDLNPVATEFQQAAQSIRDRLSFRDLSLEWRNRITDARLTRPEEPWIANRFESAAYGTEVHARIGRMMKDGLIPGGEKYQLKGVGPDLVPRSGQGLSMEITRYTPSLNAIVTHAKRYSTDSLRYILYQSR